MLVNGKEMSFEKDLTVEELLTELQFEGNRVVVEVDLHIIPKEEYSSKRLQPYSKVEIIKFVGGG